MAIELNELKKIKKPKNGADAVSRGNAGKFVAGKRPKENRTTGIRLYQDIGTAIDQTGKKRSLFLQEAAEWYLQYLYGEDTKIMGLLPNLPKEPAKML